MNNSAEFSEEELVCTEHEKQSKRYAYKFKYYGRAHGILNIYVPAHVTAVILVLDEEFYTCQLVESIKYHNGRYKLVSAECFPINLIKTPSRKLSVVVKSYAHFSNAPHVIADCEYIRRLYNHKNPLGKHTDSDNNHDIELNDDCLYHNTTQFLSQGSFNNKRTVTSSPRNIKKKKSSDYQHVGSVPLSGIPLSESPLSKSKGISDILKYISNK